MGKETSFFWLNMENSGIIIIIIIIIIIKF
jgi:hypothetical protein